MCLGGGGQPYNAYGGDFQKYETAFNDLSNQYLTQARDTGTIEGFSDFSSLNDMLNRMSEDPQARMEAQEMSRQHDIKLGQIGIDKAFGRFGDDYYDQYKTDYTGYYYPQLDTQFEDAKAKLTAALAGRGILESTAGFDKLGDLTKEYTDAKSNIANESLDAANKLRGQVENSKSNLYSLNEVSADPKAVNAQATGQATALVAPPQYSPLGQVFAAALAPFANYQQAASNTPTRSYTSPYSTAAVGSAGSGRVVR